MLAPILFEKEYELNIEIEQDACEQVFLRVEKLYSYDNVWAARNEYEKFFSAPDVYDENPDSEPVSLYYDRWINMIGNEKCMIVKKVYIQQFESLDKAELEKERLNKELEDLKERNNIFDFDKEDDEDLWSSLVDRILNEY